MYKELVISIIIVALIFGLNYLTQKNTDYTVAIVTDNLEILRQDIVKENQDKEFITSNMNAIYDKWEELDDKMAYYIEHNELEKVKTALTSSRSFIEEEEYSDAIESIDRCIYILDHIHEREMFTLDNIF